MAVSRKTFLVAGLTLMALVGGVFWVQQYTEAQELVISDENEAKQGFNEIADQLPNPTIEPNSITTAGVAPESGLSAPALTFPQIGIYGSLLSGGWPITDFDTGILDPTAVQAYAKRHVVFVPPTPVSDTRLDIAPALRAVNPNLKIYAYTMAATTWCGSGYAVGSYYRDYWMNATNDSIDCNPSTDRLLWLQNGTRADATGVNVNLAHRVDLGGGTYQYDYAEDLAQIIYDHVVTPTQPDTRKIFDGIFIDVYCDGIDWMEPTDVGHLYNAGTNFDYVRAGYGSVNNETSHIAFHAGWKAGHIALATKLRQLIGDNDYPIIGNCGQEPAEEYGLLNGWMRENFPFQNGGTWFSNMYRRPGGYLHQEQDFRSPRYNISIAWATPNDQPYTASNMRKQRFVLASMSLGNGLGILQTDGVVADQIYHDWWFDEYGVDRVTGASSTDLDDMGWLGEATSDDYQMIWMDSANDIANSVTNNGFETNTTGWNLNAFPGGAGTFVRDATTAGVGSASAKLTVVTPSEFNWFVNAATANTMSVTANQSYAVTFWAKGSVNRPIVPTLGNAALILPITTEWKRYQVVLTPTASSSSAFRFDVANVAGDVWFDDVHIQTQVTNVYRRDFQYGIVLVNPHSSSKTFTLEPGTSFKRIQGVRDTTTNNGAVATSVTLQGLSGGIGDALFLRIVDSTAPNAVTDLSAQ
jgi:hypothetical protein